jgi:hypothetical protein
MNVKNNDTDSEKNLSLRSEENVAVFAANDLTNEKIVLSLAIATVQSIAAQGSAGRFWVS